MAAVPIWVVFTATALLIVLTLELGYRLGCAAHRRPAKEKESPVGAFAAAMLGLVAFMLGFTFSLVAEKYSARKENVRKEATAIQTAFLRAKFLPEPDRTRSRELLISYVASIARPTRPDVQVTVELDEAFALHNDWHRRLWTIVDEDSDSSLGSLYVQSLNEVFDLRAERAMLDVVERVRIPIWAALYLLTCLAVMSVSYQSGVAGSKRSKVGLLLTASFALVITLIADLDRVGGMMRVSHAPFTELHRTLASANETAISSP